MGADFAVLWNQLRTSTILGFVFSLIALVSCIVFFLVGGIQKNKRIGKIAQIITVAIVIGMFIGLIVVFTQFSTVSFASDFSYSALAHETFYTPMAALIGLIPIMTALTVCDIIKSRKAKRIEGEVATEEEGVEG